MLSDILKEKRCFKLVCGAGNEDEQEVEKLVFLYSKAGANFFDVCAKPEIIKAAKRGLQKAGILKDRYICCSVGIKGDPHVNKAFINDKNCSGCGACEKACLQNAVYKEEIYRVQRFKCIGCGACIKVCPKNSIKMQSIPTNLKKVLPEIISAGIDCIEYHALCANDTEVFKTWEIINKSFDGMLSICIDRSKLGNDGVISRLKKMLSIRQPYTTIIQADGCPMSGSRDDYKTTLQAVAMAEIITDANLPVYLLISGGTNSKTKTLANLCSIESNGIAIGTYARKIVKNYIQKEDFFDNPKIINDALEIAKDLVKTCV